MCEDELDIMNWMRGKKEVERRPYIRNPSVKELI